jgi:GNAT superfamily N-acetyltransferase
MDEITIAPPQAGDKADWRRLYEGYATFYKRPMNDDIADRVWSWVTGGSGVLDALVAHDGKGRVVGLAHFRQMPRPLTGTMAGFLDDLFVEPELRGRGVGEKLIEALKQEGRRRGWTIIRWLTADDNYRARFLYDQHATRTGWITYQIDL